LTLTLNYLLSFDFASQIANPERSTTKTIINLSPNPIIVPNSFTLPGVPVTKQTPEDIRGWSQFSDNTLKPHGTGVITAAASNSLGVAN
jgi:hypothetical protein